MAVYTFGSIAGLSEDIGIASLVLHQINLSDPVLAAPSGFNVCLRVGGPDVKRNMRLIFTKACAH